jgi:hypothetical protein
MLFHHSAHHGCFGRLSKEASQPINCHSSEWTRVIRKNGRNKEEISEERNLELFLQKSKRVEGPAVAPKNDFHTFHVRDSIPASRTSPSPRSL